MKYIRLAISLFCTMLLPITALASETAPEEPLKRISWAMEKCGPMPDSMIIGFVLLAVMLAITILIAKKKEDESR